MFHVCSSPCAVVTRKQTLLNAYRFPRVSYSAYLNRTLPESWISLNIWVFLTLQFRPLCLLPRGCSLSAHHQHTQSSQLSLSALLLSRCLSAAEAGEAPLCSQSVSHRWNKKHNTLFSKCDGLWDSHFMLVGCKHNKLWELTLFILFSLITLNKSVLFFLIIGGLFVVSLQLRLNRSLWVWLLMSSCSDWQSCCSFRASKDVLFSHLKKLYELLDVSVYCSDNLVNTWSWSSVSHMVRLLLSVHEWFLL